MYYGSAYFCPHNTKRITTCFDLHHCYTPIIPMAEESGKKRRRKLEFTPEGETLGYISLDQARVLALQYAEIIGRFTGATLTVSLP